MKSVVVVPHKQAQDQAESTITQTNKQKQVKQVDDVNPQQKINDQSQTDADEIVASTKSTKANKSNARKKARKKRLEQKGIKIEKKQLLDKTKSQKHLSQIERLERKRRESIITCLLYTSPSPRDKRQSRMPSSA